MMYNCQYERRLKLNRKCVILKIVSIELKTVFKGIDIYIVENQS